MDRSRFRAQRISRLYIPSQLFTKAYELLKKTGGSSRVTLYIAFRIAEAYHDGGQYDMALRFFDRISKTYRREHWGAISDRIRALWLDCAKREGKHDDVARLLIETIALGLSSSKSDPQQELLTLLEVRSPVAHDPWSLTAFDPPISPRHGRRPNPPPLSPSSSAVPTSRRCVRDSIFQFSALETTLTETLLMSFLYSPVECSSTFWLESAVMGQPVPYQIALSTTPDGGPIDCLPFDSVRVDFANGHPSVTVLHEPSQERPQVQLVRLAASQSSTAHLRWRKEDMLVLSGLVTSPSMSEIKVSLP